VPEKTESCPRTPKDMERTAIIKTKEMRGIAKGYKILRYTQHLGQLNQVQRSKVRVADERPRL